ncbi:MAG: YdiU family protein, partial [Desulfuromonadales bacterium]|nr:YdiU family protein [Desulfuromonadales bacterium]
RELIAELQEVLTLAETDMTLFYRALADLKIAADAQEELLLAPLQEIWYRPEQLAGDQRERTVAWLRRYLARVRQDGVADADRRRRMNAVNPKYVLRNYLAQLAIDQAEAGDYALVGTLLEVLRRPYDEQPQQEEFARKRPDWARHRAGCSMLSCSS